MENRRNLLEIANANILYRNFSGLEKKAMVNGTMRTVNDAGNRNFTVIIDPVNSEVYWNGERVTNPDFGQELADMGYNVSVKPGREEGDPVQYRLPVAVSYNGTIKPHLYLVTKGNKVLMDEQMVDELDMADIVKADIAINNGRPYINNQGQEKVKAWCNEGYFVIAQSRFASEYDFDAQ